MITNALTIDVEDYFQVSAFAPFINRGTWDEQECRVEANIARILALLDRNSVKATFFTLGWIAERYPSIVHRIVADGHELASHGYGHQRANDLSPDGFAADVSKAKAILEDLGGVEVRGYRAPSFSIDAGNFQSAFECLARVGYTYSSSVYPVRHDHYGMPDAPRFAYAPVDKVTEIPPTTVNFFGRNWPASGGGFFRLLPYSLSRALINRVNRHESQPAVFYFHPWEIDPRQPRVPGIDMKTRFRHYVNLDRMEHKLSRLLQDFRWGPMYEVFLQG